MFKMVRASRVGGGNVPLVVLTQQRVTSLLKGRKQVVGRGASCEVSLVEVEGELCCLKVAKEQRFMAMFRKEFEILMDLQGAAGAPLPLGTSFGFPALLTTFCGEKTFCHLPLVAATDEDKFCAFLSLVRNVQQLHACGYTHNDIKENNIVVRREADAHLQVSLIDYGLATRVGTPSPQHVGKEAQRPWLAPELHHGTAYKPPGDVYSLGYVLQNILNQCEARYPSLEVLASTALAPKPAHRPSLATMANTIKMYTPLKQNTTNNCKTRRTFRKVFAFLFSCFGKCQKS